MKIGIFFGGTSREREISFAGGRTVFDNLDKALFQPVPIFVDSLGQFILLDWQFIYKGTIRDFYPPVSSQPPSLHQLQVYIESLGELSHDEKFEAIAKVGRQVQAEQLPLLMDFAFLALHGPGGEDGAIQGLLEWLGIPYSGSGILPSAFGIDKIAQKNLLHALGRPTPAFRVIKAEEWDTTDHAATLAYLVREIGLPLVLKAPRQGSSIGISILKTADLAAFEAAIDRSLFRKTVTRADWQRLGEPGKIAWVQQLADIREGIGLPVILEEVGSGEREVGDLRELDAHAPLPISHAQIYHPETLIFALSEAFESVEQVRLTSVDGETQVLVESFVAGREFSCIVVEDPSGQPLALPPTEIVKGEELFDYRSKYLPGLARKVTPIDLPEDQIQEIRAACEEMFRTFGFQVYARLDGFYVEGHEGMGVGGYEGKNLSTPTLPPSYPLSERPEHDVGHAAGVVLLPPGGRNRAESFAVSHLPHSHLAGRPPPRRAAPREAGAAAATARCCRGGPPARGHRAHSGGRDNGRLLFRAAYFGGERAQYFREAELVGQVCAGAGVPHRLGPGAPAVRAARERDAEGQRRRHSRED